MLTFCALIAKNSHLRGEQRPEIWGALAMPAGGEDRVALAFKSTSPNLQIQGSSCYFTFVPVLDEQVFVYGELVSWGAQNLNCNSLCFC